MKIIIIKNQFKSKYILNLLKITHATLLIIFLSLFTSTFSSSSSSLRTLTKIENLIIYLATHKDFNCTITNRKYYKIVTDELSSLKNYYPLDKIFTKDNNPYYYKRIGYGEFSKLYYIYKYYTPLPDYVGFTQYRRFFTFYNRVPNMDRIFKTHDVILPELACFDNTTYIEFSKEHWNGFLDKALEIMNKYFPEYNKTAEQQIFRNRCNFFNNLFIMKKNDFLKFGHFLFTILEEFDKFYGFNDDKDILEFVSNHEILKKKDISYQRRLQGFVLERLSQIFFMHNFKRIKILPRYGPDRGMYKEENFWIKSLWNFYILMTIGLCLIKVVWLLEKYWRDKNEKMRKNFLEGKVKVVKNTKK